MAGGAWRKPAASFMTTPKTVCCRCGVNRELAKDTGPWWRGTFMPVGGPLRHGPLCGPCGCHSEDIGLHPVREEAAPKVVEGAAASPEGTGQMVAGLE